ncbi:DoxX family protein [Fulvivirgaceae bacterium BMA12]|uniref:DoxX family protein n=1 Tax=Agaribacillus aureus TaxID=3051825 RepID=A0ABT8LE54_9BACT|nr:DoxX family protein [Fulvivirgaceae bacterium BMA12]
MKINQKRIKDLAGLYLRLMLGFTLLSAVADRFGLWGAPGAEGVAWGNWENFVTYTYQLNAFAGGAMAPVLATIVTGLEILFGTTLILGYKTRWTALGTAALILLFALAMTYALGIKAPLDYSVFVDSAAALLLAGIAHYRWSIDERLQLKKSQTSI